jgi:hypothetical protein
LETCLVKKDLVSESFGKIFNTDHCESRLAISIVLH